MKVYNGNVYAYLASLAPSHGLYPADPKERAIVDQWSYWQAIHIGPDMQKAAFAKTRKAFGMGEPDEETFAKQMKSVDPALDILDAALTGKDWIAGPLTIADFALPSTFMLRGPAGISLESRPHVDAWITRLEGRPSWQRAAKPFLDFMRSRGIDSAVAPPDFFDAP